ncbi:MAG: HAMP domain-containing histidine kinase, partial [Rhodospirillaceae bacterium]|nr:HAMP domain-containing histidine kinase [Rhodospirillaceae bacterium]
MSHELRTPLNAIIGFADMLLMEVKGPLGNPSYKEYVSDIKNSGVHLSKILVDILDVSKIETGNVDLDEEYVVIPNVTSSCMRIVHPRSEEKGIMISENIPEGLPRLYVDTVKLKQILINLLTNAIKYTQNGGTVELTVVVGKDGKIAFHIIDNGIGMAAKDIPRALEPFGQLADVLTRDQEGVGLGLHLTKALVELHDGRLGIDSTLGEGTTVSVIFSAERTDSPPRPS